MFHIVLNLLEKLVLAIAIGGIVGLEREHTKRQTLLGLRTFSLISLLGMLLTELSKDYYFIASSIGLVGIFALTVSFYFFKATHFRHSLGLTTIMMLPLTYILGMLIALNYVLEAIAAAIITTYVLIEKGEVHHLVEKISRREIVDFLIFAIIAFVIYPLVPSEAYLLFGHEVSPQSFVLAVILISLISFVAHVVTRVIHHNAVVYASFFGGLISSLATVMLFARDRKVGLDALKLSFTSSSAGMLLRDSLLLLFLNLPLFRASIFLFVVPLLAFVLLTQYYSRTVNVSRLQFVYREPISLLFVLRFALILFAVTTSINAVSDIRQPTLLYGSFLIGGAVNSASVIASIAFLFSEGSLPEGMAFNGILFGLLGSAISKLAVAYSKDKPEHSKYLLFLIGTSFVALMVGYALSSIYSI